MVMLEFSGKELTNNRVFDTTSEQEARENGLYSENAKFGPVPVVVGHNDVLPALDEALSTMKEGEERTLRIPPEKAFGERRKELVVVAPLQAFLSHKINPVPGLIVDLNGTPGRVQTVSGGRVRVDLNNDLAGKEVEYTLRVAREIVGAREKAQALTEKFFPLRGRKAEARLENGTLKVKLPKEHAQQAGNIIAAFTKTAREVVPELKTIEVVESFEAKAGNWEKQEKNTEGEKAAHAGEEKQETARSQEVAHETKIALEVKKTDSTMIVKPKPKERLKTMAPSKSTDSTAIWHAKKKTRPS